MQDEEMRKITDDEIKRVENKLSKKRPILRIIKGKVIPVRSGPKIGRNDPCVCGSGWKFKKCCMFKI